VICLVGFQIHRFYNDEKQNPKFPWERTDTQKHVEKPLPAYKVAAPLLKPEGGGIGDGKQSTSKTSTFGRLKAFPENHILWQKGILDPGSDIFLQWNRIFMFFCLVALFVDPLFFYLPEVVNSDGSSCMTTDLNLGIVITCFRTIADMFYMLNMVIKFRTAYVSPSSRVFGRGELVMDPKMIARRYLRSEFFIDLIAALPLPQVLPIGLTLIYVQLVLWSCIDSKIIEGKIKKRSIIHFLFRIWLLTYR
jgi:cyclic nucleotide gated channel